MYRIAVFALLLTVAPYPGVAQVVNFIRGNENSVLTDVRGEPFSERKFSDVEGHPFLQEGWKLASITLVQGHTYNNLPVRINAATQQVHYLSNEKSSRELVLDRTRISRLVIQDSINKTTRTYEFFYDKIGNVLIAEILVDGVCRLLRVDKKTVAEEKLFNSATVYKKFQSSRHYFIFKDKNLHALKKPDRDIIALLQDRNTEIQAYLNPKKKIKTEEDMVNVVAYYNQLKESKN